MELSLLPPLIDRRPKHSHPPKVGTFYLPGPPRSAGAMADQLSVCGPLWSSWHFRFVPRRSKHIRISLEPWSGAPEERLCGIVHRRAALLLALRGFALAAQRKLTLYDVVLTRMTDGSGKTAARADLRVRSVVQGAVVVLENKTGRVLALTGGFSYPLSQLNRATQAVRQPGSAIKPLSYLAALGKGLQPNTLISDDPITL